MEHFGYGFDEVGDDIGVALFIDIDKRVVSCSEC